MELNLEILKPQERVSLQLRVLYEQAGYRKYHMGRFEEYGLYQENLRFLSSEQVITFTDLDGRLLALKPDVTLSIAKNAQPAQGECERYYYAENVYRPSQESHTFREISQMGLECIGAVDTAAMVQVVSLALSSLELTGEPFALELSHMYAEMAKTAEAEGFLALAAQFEGVAAIEKTHEERYLKLLENLKNGEVFQKGEKVMWFCRNCGHVEIAVNAPAVCPVCKHPQSYFQLRAENY